MNTSSAPGHRWEPDVLGGTWQALTLALQPDPCGEPVATLVRQRPEAGPRPDADSHSGPGQPAVLYLHGFTDYFFHPEHAQGWAAAGYSFYALDLRDYGRSIRAGRQPGWTSDLRIYFEEITQALRELTAAGHHQVVLLGHSTGGLIAALYADAHPGAVAALVLNSPWFDLNEPWLARRLVAPVAARVGRWLPGLRVSALNPAYGRSLHLSTGGEFDYDLAWKPLHGFPVQAGWLRAILAAQRQLARGLDILCPVLVCTSTRSGDPARPTAADLASADCVLDVAQMHARAPRLGPDVQVKMIDGGRHDLALSEPQVRRDYLNTVLAWLDQRLPSDTSGRVTDPAAR